VKHRVFAYVFFLVASTMLISFCSRPKEVLSKKEMEKLLYDIYIAEALIESDYATFDTPEKKKLLYNRFFVNTELRKHNGIPRFLGMPIISIFTLKSTTR